MLPNGLVEKYFIDKDKDSVCILALTSSNLDVVLVKQFRANTESVQIELPGGTVEPDEPPEQAATRELREETGFSGKMIHLASVHYSPYSSGIRHMFLAIECTQEQELDLDPNEFLKPFTVSLEVFREELLMTGRVRDFGCAYLGLDKMGLLTET